MQDGSPRPAKLYVEEKTGSESNERGRQTSLRRRAERGLDEVIICRVEAGTGAV